MRFLFVVLFMVLATHVSAQERVPDQDVEQTPAQTEPAKEPAIQPSGTESGIEPVAPAQPPKQEHDQGTADDSGGHPGDDLIFGDGWAQWLMAITGVVALFVSAWAVWLVRRSLILTRQAVEAAVRSADLAERAIADTRELGEVQTRAYLAVTGGTAVFKGSLEPEVFIKIRNGGNSPAFNVAAKFQRNNAMILEARPVGSNGGAIAIHVNESSVAKIIGAGIEQEYSIGVFGKIAGSGKGSISGFGYNLEGLLEYQTIFDVKSDNIDMDTTFLFLFAADRDHLETAVKAGKEVRCPMQLMPAFMSGWIIDYRRIAKAARDTKRAGKQKA